MHAILVTALITAVVSFPAGAYFWPKLASRLKADAQKVETVVTKFKASRK